MMNQQTQIARVIQKKMPRFFHPEDGVSRFLFALEKPTDVVCFVLAHFVVHILGDGHTKLFGVSSKDMSSRPIPICRIRSRMYEKGSLVEKAPRES